ncbi:MAG: hypothetical protein KC503_17710 [Myxococcales bacterium]|nr:hypothetical protein [Myxococcales bacterium]
MRTSCVRALALVVTLVLVVAQAACSSDDATAADSTVDTSGGKDASQDQPLPDVLPPPDSAPDVPPPDSTMDLPPDTTGDLPPGPSARINVSVDTSNVTCTAGTAGSDCIGTLVILVANASTQAQVAIHEQRNADLSGGTIISHTFYTLPVNTQLEVGAALFETSPTPTPTQPDVGDIVTQNMTSFTHTSATDNKVIDLLLDLRCSAGADTPVGAPPLSMLLLAGIVLVARRRRRRSRSRR